MRRIISVLAVLAIVAAMLVAMAMPAFASHRPSNPYAVVYNGSGENGKCVDTYRAPGGKPSSGNNAGGDVGDVYNGTHGAGC